MTDGGLENEQEYLTGSILDLQSSYKEADLTLKEQDLLGLSNDNLIVPSVVWVTLLTWFIGQGVGFEAFSKVQSSGNSTSFHIIVLGIVKLTWVWSVKKIIVWPLSGGTWAKELDEFKTF